MGKRSDFERIDRDYYPTPIEAVRPLAPFIKHAKFMEPCAGDGRLIKHIEALGIGALCKYAYDIEPKADFVHQRDALTCRPSNPELFITNPPWDRKILHPLIEHLTTMAPCWLLFDADWVHTKQAARFMPWLAKIVSVGRVKWIEDSKMTGKDNCAWYLFDRNHEGATEFHGR